MHRLILLFIYYLHQSDAYSIKVQGKVDLGKDLGVLFKDVLQDIILNEEGTTTIDLAKLLSLNAFNFKPELGANKESFKNTKDDKKNDKKLIKSTEEGETSKDDLLDLDSDLEEEMKKIEDNESTRGGSDLETSESDTKIPSEGKSNLKASEKINKKQSEEKSYFKSSQKRIKKDEPESEEQKISIKLSQEDSDDETSDNEIEESKKDEIQKSEEKVMKNLVEMFIPKEDLQTLHVRQSDQKSNDKDKPKGESGEKPKDDSDEKQRKESDDKPRNESDEKQKSESDEKLKIESDSKDTELDEKQSLQSYELRMKFNTGRRTINEDVTEGTGINQNRAENVDTNMYEQIHFH